ncbi:hypothetical protein LWI29_027520 [Acer saccharum]|uniref:Uncharacterized protein n=1 Tax=Acer saccharum TaxID=4024 RepID=A0AA39VC24_ACESA|nr:hypothetical protein LWI29_027520 [Acer saccharum]
MSVSTAKTEWRRSHGNELRGVPMEVSWENGRLGLRVDADDFELSKMECDGDVGEVEGEEANVCRGFTE